MRIKDGRKQGVQRMKIDKIGTEHINTTFEVEEED